MAPVAVPCQDTRAARRGWGQAGEGAAHRIPGLSRVWLRDRAATGRGLCRAPLPVLAGDLSFITERGRAPACTRVVLRTGLVDTCRSLAGACCWALQLDSARLEPVELPRCACWRLTSPREPVEPAAPSPATQALAAWAVVGSDFGLVPLRDRSDTPLPPPLRAPRAGRWKGIGAAVPGAQLAGKRGSPGRRARDAVSVATMSGPSLRPGRVQLPLWGHSPQARPLSPHGAVPRPSLGPLGTQPQCRGESWGLPGEDCVLPPPSCSLCKGRVSPGLQEGKLRHG